MSDPPSPNHPMDNFENLTPAPLSNDITDDIVPFSQGDSDDLTIAALPDDVIQKIVSFLPEFPREATGLGLKQVFKSLALPRLRRSYANLFTEHASGIRCIDPFPGVEHTKQLANPPLHAEIDFLCLLVSICPGLYSLRAPSVKGVLGCIRHQLKELSFIDDGLRFHDLNFLSRSSLTVVSVTDPTWVVISTLSRIRTLKRVSLFRVSSNVVGSSAAHLLNATSLSYLLLDLSSLCDEDLKYLLRRLPALQTFVLKCDIRHAWNALKYLREVAREVGNVHMIVDGVRIVVQRKDASLISDLRWEASVWQILVYRRELSSKPPSQPWPRGMSLRELDLDLLHEIYAHQSSHPEKVDDHFLNCSESAPVDIDFTVRLGRKIPSKKQAIVRGNWIKASRIPELATSLVISQDLIRYASQGCRHWAHDFLKTISSNFTNISTLHICKPAYYIQVSGKFILALSDFLEMITEKCKELKMIYLEDAGDLVLQARGAPTLKNEKKLKEALEETILLVKEKESISKIDMGTVIAQLEIWASRELNVDLTVAKREMIR